MANGKRQMAVRLRAFQLTFAVSLLPLVMPLVLADQVVMKDGTVYKGKILIDTDKAILIGNPPFDPNSFLLETPDIAKIIYEEYHPNPPAERRRGVLFETRLDGNVFSSQELPLSPAAGIYAGAGFRVHPAIEIDGGIQWNPGIGATDGFSVSDSTNPAIANTRRYQDFYMYSGVVTGRIYPFFGKKWKTEPYVLAGYSWSRLIPKASGDRLKGSGWLFGLGAHHPLTTHLFLEGRFAYQSTSLDTISFIGREGSIRPEIAEHVFCFGVGLSYRL